MRREIVIPVAAIKRKMPELGLASQDQQTVTGGPKVDPSAELGGGHSEKVGGAKTGKMAFALVTKAGKKLNVQKIELSSDSQLV